MKAVDDRWKRTEFADAFLSKLKSESIHNNNIQCWDNKHNRFRTLKQTTSRIRKLPFTLTRRYAIELN